MDFYKNEVSEHGCFNLCESIIQLENLEFLNIKTTNNKILDDGVQAFSKILSSYKHLKILKL